MGNKTLAKQLYIGVDGGATKCIVRVEDENGQLLGQEMSGPANIRISVDQAWQSIHSALNKILPSHSISKNNYQIHCGMGLAGCEVSDAYHEFIKREHDFQTLMVSSDAHTACLGAHNGKDGAIIVIGTGVVGFQVKQNQIAKIAGWGFPHDDAGGGAWLGLEAVKLTFRTVDGRCQKSGVQEAILSHFNQDIDNLVAWANRANSTAFAELAPIVIAQSKKGDVMAQQLLQQAAYEIDEIATTLLRVNQLPIALVGGIAPFVQPFLHEDVKKNVFPCYASPDVGAIILVKKHLEGMMHG